MRFHDGNRTVFICDVCGDNSIENPKIRPAHPAYEHHWFHEEPSFGGGSDSENALYDYTRENQPASGAYADHPREDTWETLNEAAQSKRIEYCGDCFDDHDPDDMNYMDNFDAALRQRRSEILLKMVKESRVIPGIRDEDKVYASLITIGKQNVADLKEKLIEIAKSQGTVSDWTITELMSAVHALKQTELAAEEGERIS